MAYTKLTDFAVKDALLTGNPAKVVRGTEIDAELNAIAAADALNLSAASIVAATSKTTPIDADLIPLVDSAASNVLKKLTWANLKATLLTWLQGTVLPSPGPIGSTTPSTGAFTSLSATGDITSSSTSGRLTFSNAGTSGNAGVQNNNGSAYALMYPSAHSTKPAHLDISSVNRVALQNAGSDIAVVTSTGLAVTGALSATGKYQISGSGSVPTASLLEIGTNGVGSRWLYNAPAGGEHNFNVNGSTIAYVNAAGVGVTGALSATGNIDFGSGTTLSAYMDVAKPNAGGTVDVGIHNSDNTNVNSHAQLRIYSGGASGGDPIINLEVSGVSTRRYIGIDNSNSDLFVIGRGYSPGVADDLTINASGNLGLGVTPSAWGAGKSLSLFTTTSIFNDGTAGYYSNNLYFDGAWKYKTSAAASIYAQPASGSHEWYTAAAGAADASVTITKSLSFGKGTTLALEGATSAAGTGIAFPATQLASSNANTLDDYEYGSFTATIDGTTTAGTGTYTTQVGRYKKIGRLVQFQLNLVWSSHTGTGNLKVSGLPFITGSTANSLAAVSIYNAGIAMTAGSVMQAFTNVSGTTVVLEQVPTGGGSSTAIPMDTAGQIILTGTYESA